MASIRKEIQIEAGAGDVWAAVRDVGAVHRRLVPGFLVDTRLEGNDVRIVTFANGMVLRELIVDVDDAAHRLVWSAIGGRLTHHNASVQVFPEGAHRCRLIWAADLLPNAIAGDIDVLMEQGIGVIKQTLERVGSSARG